MLYGRLQRDRGVVGPGQGSLEHSSLSLSLSFSDENLALCLMSHIP